MAERLALRQPSSEFFALARWKSANKVTPLTELHPSQLDYHLFKATNFFRSRSGLLDSCSEDSDPSIRLEDVRCALSKIRGSMDEAVDEVRGDYSVNYYYDTSALCRNYHPEAGSDKVERLFP